MASAVSKLYASPVGQHHFGSGRGGLGGETPLVVVNDEEFRFKTIILQKPKAAGMFNNST